MYYGNFNSLLILIPAVILTFYAQIKLKSSFSKYSQIRNSKGITGARAAEIILANNGLRSVPVGQVAGNLTDHYDPRNKYLNLSESVYGSTSIAAIGVAAHECGHAVQDSEGYALLRFRNSIVPVVNIGSRLSWPLLVVGLAIGVSGLYTAGLIMFLLVVLFHLVTLPMEIDASRRGLRMLQEYGIVESSDEVSAVRQVLSAAALTYLAALAMAVANLLRILAMSRRRN
jgi:Zn-dependent membrane protease YugP